MSFDADRIASLVDGYAAALRAVAARLSDQPDDCVQEAFCRLVAQRRWPDQPGAWLFKVVRNLARETHRSRSRREQREAIVARNEAMDDDPWSHADAALARGELLELDDETQNVVVMRLWADLTFEEIGAATGLSAATAHRRFVAGLNELRKRMNVPCPKNE